jgi:hypothetical protein
MSRPTRLIIIALALGLLGVAAPGQAQPASTTWRVIDGEAIVSNGETGFGVSCRRAADGEAGPMLVFRPPPEVDLGDSFTARLQISTTADAYQINAATEIDTLAWRFERQGGRYAAAEPLSAEAGLDATLDSLRAGMNLVIGAGAFDRAQRYSLVGSNRAIEIVLADCG